jgi:hypothetical protein
VVGFLPIAYRTWIGKSTPDTDFLVPHTVKSFFVFPISGGEDMVENKL